MQSDNSVTQPEYCCRSTLLKRGWTEAGIKRFLESPDKTVPNPHYSRSEDMKLYNLARVERTEQSSDYKAYLEKNRKRREGANNAIKTKRDKLLHRVAGWEIYIPRQNLTDVIQDAISSYNSRLVDRSEDGFIYEPASMQSGKEFLHRITVNFLRHRCTPYERQLIGIAGKVGTKEAYILLNQNIFKKIAELYPELASECDRQLEEKIKKHLEASNNLNAQTQAGQLEIADFT